MDDIAITARAAKSEDVANIAKAEPFDDDAARLISSEVIDAIVEKLVETIDPADGPDRMKEALRAPCAKARQEFATKLAARSRRQAAQDYVKGSALAFNPFPSAARLDHEADFAAVAADLARVMTDFGQVATVAVQMKRRLVKLRG